jgi:hypothetical protein
MNNPKTDSLQNLYTSINSTLDSLYTVDESVFNVIAKEQLQLDLTKVLRGIIKSAQQESNKLKDTTKQQPGQRKLTFFPGTYVDDIKLLRCVGKKDGKYFPLGMYTIVKNGERVGEVCVQDLRDALDKSTSEANVYENKSIIKYGVELPTGNSVHAQFFKLVLETVEENCDKETLAKVVEVYKSPAQFPADENYKAMLTKVWELCGTEVARRLYLKLDEANLKGCWLIGYPSI